MLLYISNEQKREDRGEKRTIGNTFDSHSAVTIYINSLGSVPIFRFSKYIHFAWLQTNDFEWNIEPISLKRTSMLLFPFILCSFGHTLAQFTHTHQMANVNNFGFGYSKCPEVLSVKSQIYFFHSIFFFSLFYFDSFNLRECPFQNVIYGIDFEG